MNVIALIVAIAAFLCFLAAVEATRTRPQGRRAPWPGWMQLGLAFFVASFIIQLVFAPHSLVQYTG